MAKVSGVACPGCKAANDAEFKKPKPFQPSIFKMTCANCGSKFRFTISKGKGLASNQVRMDYKLVEISEKLKTILKTREEHGENSNHNR